jgi:hypothetical protein
MRKAKSKESNVVEEINTLQEMEKSFILEENDDITEWTLVKKYKKGLHMNQFKTNFPETLKNRYEMLQLDDTGDEDCAKLFYNKKKKTKVFNGSQKLVISQNSSQIWSI